MEIFDELKEDHEKLKTLMNRIEETTERAVKTRTELLAEMKTVLLSHAKAEEAAFYQNILDEDETHDQALEALEEHRLAENLLEELEDVDPSDETWLPKFKVMKEGIEHHIEEEEQDLFKKARKILSHEEAEDLADVFQELKSEVMDELRA